MLTSIGPRREPSDSLLDTCFQAEIDLLINITLLLTFKKNLLGFMLDGRYTDKILVLQFHWEINEGKSTYCTYLWLEKIYDKVNTLELWNIFHESKII